MTGMSHHAKATSGSLAVRGCGCRYSGTPHGASQHRTTFSLRTGADLYGGILTLRTHAVVSVFPAFSSDVLFVILSLLCFEARSQLPPHRMRGHVGAASDFIILGSRGEQYPALQGSGCTNPLK